MIANLSLILTNRSWSENIATTLRTPNRAMALVFAGTIGSLLLVLFVPVLRDLFGFGPVSLPALVLCAVAGAASIAWFEVYKYWRIRKAAQG